MDVSEIKSKEVWLVKSGDIIRESPFSFIRVLKIVTRSKDSKCVVSWRRGRVKGLSTFKMTEKVQTLRSTVHNEGV